MAANFREAWKEAGEIVRPKGRVNPEMLALAILVWIAIMFLVRAFI